MDCENDFGRWKEEEELLEEEQAELVGRVKCIVSLESLCCQLPLNATDPLGLTRFLHIGLNKLFML